MCRQSRKLVPSCFACMWAVLVRRVYVCAQLISQASLGTVSSNPISICLFSCAAAYEHRLPFLKGGASFDDEEIAV